MRRNLLMFVVLVFCLILPGTVFHYWSWNGIKPDLAMLWVIYIALHHKPVEGVIYGGVIGLIVDLYFGRYIGLCTVSFALVAFLVGLLQQRWYRENVVLTMALVFMVTFLGQSMMMILASTAGLNWYLGDAYRMIFGIALYNCLLVPLTYPFIHKSFTTGYLRQESLYRQRL